MRLDMTAGNRYIVTRIWGHIPTLAQGRTGDDRPFYFRAQDGSWTLEVGPVGVVTDYREWPAGKVLEIAGGVDPSGGWMENFQVLAALESVFVIKPIIQPVPPKGIYPWRGR
jgi:hypothetical protein